MLEDLEVYAKENNIPIMQKDGIEYLCDFISKNKIRNILEIGSAIGYSAIKMALVDSNIKITTIEKDEQRAKLALENIEKFKLNKQIELKIEDAKDSIINDTFDLIFIDASKGNNITFFEKYQVNLKENGVIITDNLSFHGLVEDESLIKTKNQRGLVNKIKEYITFLDNNLEFDTIYVKVGDKIAISRRKGM